MKDPIRKSGVFFVFYRDVVQLVACVLWEHEVADSSSAIPTNYLGVSELVEAAGLGNQSRHKGSVVRGFEPHLSDEMVIVEELVDSSDCESEILRVRVPSFTQKYVII